jgi:hypothetical protein
MKLTINVDDALLDRVVKVTGASTKTEAITHALREVDRRARLVALLREGTGATPEELTGLFEQASDPGSLRVAETSGRYGSSGGQP